MSYVILDLETTSETRYKRIANPFYNRILCSGLKYEDGRLLTSAHDFMTPGWLDGVSIIVGHNLKFDLLYLWKDKELQEFFRNGGKIWCTQLTEYMISGQQHKYPGLRDISVNKYGRPTRVKHIQEGFNKGLNTSNIDIKLLLEDVSNDVLDTEAVAIAQIKQTKSLGMYKLVNSQMDALLATTEMEYNGFKVDRPTLEKNKEILIKKLAEEQNTLDKTIASVWPKELIFNSSSNDDLSFLFFGGTKTAIEKEEAGLFKTGARAGQAKFRNKEVEYKIAGLKIRPLPEWVTKKHGIFGTNEAILKQINHPAAKTMLKIRELNKALSTYYYATEEFIYDWDGCVHTELCHCGYEKSLTEFGGGANTGRLTCRNPNMQNQPRAGDSFVKDHFTSRYQNGQIIDIDMKQLEVVIFAYLTQDTSLVRDLNNGTDIYKVAASEVFGIMEEDVTPEQRQIVKRVILAVIYGAWAGKISTILDISFDLAQQIIDLFYTKYPMAKVWQDNLVRQVNMSKKLINDKTPKGELKHQGQYQSFTGRLYKFFTNDSLEYQVKKGILTSFNPPDIKNYIVQGTATADIMLLFLGQLWRKLLNNRDKCLLINTVHDSVVIDCKEEFVDFTCNLVKNEVQLIKSHLKSLFGIDFNVPLAVDIKIGTNWGNVK